MTEQLNVGAESHDLIAPDQLNVAAKQHDLTGAAVNGGSLKLSALQRKILLVAAQTGAVPIRELVRKCFGKVAYGSKQEFRSGVIRSVKNGKYQAAYASVSRAVRKLKNRALLQDIFITDMEVDLDPETRIEWRYVRAGLGSWVRLTDAGIEAVKSACSVRSFNRSKTVKSISSWDSFNLPAIKPVRTVDSFNSSREDHIRVFVHRPDFKNEFGGWDSNKLMTAVREELA